MADEHEIDPNAPPEKEEQPSVEELQRQVEHEQKLREDAEKTRDFWHGQATAKPIEKPIEKKEEAPDVDDLSKTDLVDIVSGNNVEGLSKVVQAVIKKTLKEMGVTTQKDVEQLVSGKLSEAKSESSGMAELVRQHPDLQDSRSELYQEAARQLDEIGKDTAYQGLSDFAKVKLATKLAAAELTKPGGAGKAEAARAARIAAQQGSTGSRKNSQREESDELNDEEKQAARVFGVTEDDFKKNKPEVKMFRR
jgi:hypothetical protein